MTWVGQPVMNAARDCEHVVWLVWHCSNRTPSAASRSRFGVAASSYADSARISSGLNHTKLGLRA